MVVSFGIVAVGLLRRRRAERRHLCGFGDSFERFWIVCGGENGAIGSVSGSRGRRVGNRDRWRWGRGRRTLRRRKRRRKSW